MPSRGKDRIAGVVVASLKDHSEEDREGDDIRDATYESRDEPTLAALRRHPPLFLACYSRAHRPVLPSKSRAMMLSMFNLSVSAIGPESSTRPEPHTEHLITRMTVDPPGFLRLRVARHSGSRSRLQRTKYLAMAARITAHSTAPLPSASLSSLPSPFLPSSFPRSLPPPFRSHAESSLARFSITRACALVVALLSFFYFSDDTRYYSALPTR